MTAETLKRLRQESYHPHTGIMWTGQQVADVLGVHKVTYFKMEWGTLKIPRCVAIVARFLLTNTVDLDTILDADDLDSGKKPLRKLRHKHGG